MFKGSIIEELINSVCRAEAHAREEQQKAAAMPQAWQRQEQYQELVEVA